MSNFSILQFDIFTIIYKLHPFILGIEREKSFDFFIITLINTPTSTTMSNFSILVTLDVLQIFNECVTK